MRGDKTQNGTGDLSGAGGRLRLYVTAPLEAGRSLEPAESQIHYLLHVMRARGGDRVLLFNGRDGEWRARIAQASRRDCTLICEHRTRKQQAVPDLWLAFAPIKKTPADYVAQKATELGVAALLPVMTERTITRRVNLDRLRANAIEAAEQSERLSVPGIHVPQPLLALLETWPQERGLLFCDEAGDATAIAEALDAAPKRSGWCVLTGPEGGFTAGERERIRQHPAAVPVTLGPRIMRADTAALAALAVWQAHLGDWRKVPSGL